MEANRKMSFRVKVLGVSVATVLLAACGGGGGSGTSNVNSSISGIAVDGPIAGATVTFTDCGNKTVTTNSDGTFTTPVGCTGSAYTVTGGTDTGTNTAFKGQLSSKYDSSSTVTVASPLTTVMVLQPVLLNKFNSLFGISSNPFTTNPLTDTASLKADLVASALLGQVTATLMNAGGVSLSATYSAVANALAKALANTSGTGSSAVLADPTFIANVITNASNTTGLTVSSATVSTITSQIAAVNAAVANVQASSNSATTLSNLQTTVLPAITSAISNATLVNYIQLSNVALNGTSKTLAQVQASTSTSPIAVSGGLNDIQISMKGIGSYVGTTQTANANLKYTIGSNTVNLTINGIQLTFDSTGALSNAIVPAGAAYTFSLSGASTASGVFSNSTQDNLFASGAVDLNINTFLSKLSGAAKLSTTQLTAYVPTQNAPTTATLAISSGAVNTPLLVGDGTGLAVSSVTATVQ